MASYSSGSGDHGTAGRPCDIISSEYEELDLAQSETHSPAFPNRDRQAVRRRRLQAGVVWLACTAVLGIAVWLKPDPRGLGTHEQLGMRPCGMVVNTGYPCPTCGMTTAFAYTVRGRLLAALIAQPTGTLLALATVAAWFGAAYVLVTGRPLPFRFPYVTPYRLFWILLALLLGGWGFKIAYGLATGRLPVR